MQTPPKPPVDSDIADEPRLQEVAFEQKLERSLGVGGNVLLTLSGISPAASVFILGGAALAGYGTGAFWGFAIGGVVSVLIALCYAELSACFPLAGGDYTLVSRSLGSAAGVAVFFVGLITLPMSQAIFALGVADYLRGTFDGVSPLAAGLVVTVISTAVACLRMRTNAWVTGAFLVVELAALSLLTGLGFTHVSHPVTDLARLQVTDGAGGLTTLGVAGLVVAVTQGILSQSGYNGSVYFAEETHEPRRAVAKAVMLSAVITVTLETVPLAAVLLGSASWSDLLGSDLPVQAFLEQRAGHALATFVLLSMALAILNANIAFALWSGRLLFAAARDRAMPAALAGPLSRVSTRAHMPVVATVVMGVLSGLCCLLPLTVVVNATGSTLAVSFGFIAVSALVARRRRGTADAGEFRMPGWPFAPAVALVAIGTIIVLALGDRGQWVSLSIAAGIVATGFAYYYGYLRRRADAIRLLLDTTGADPGPMVEPGR
ncbi:APC family permease [Kineosporia sp. R_H_3]|uniref:APC family permease n=1 Tax=Kineosporia sp. R_H_3 TaxID=1961848 RepID=UPI0018E925FA|nr:APC family permease [Kineosporia sp. R_H_3]